MRTIFRVLAVALCCVACTGIVSATTATSTTVTSSLNPSTYGTSVTFTAKVTPTAATGTVTFKDGLTTLGTGTLSSGKATFSSTTLAIGTHSITAAYSGSLSYAASTSAALTQTVNKTNTTTTVTPSQNPWQFGFSVTFTATVSPATATGTVTFKDGTTTLGSNTLSSGTTSYTLATLSAGTHSITATYNGNTLDNASTSAVLTETITKASSTTTLSSSANPSVYGSALTFTASIAPSGGTGTVTFIDGSTTLGTSTVSSGTAKYSSSTLVAGSHSITAVYSGNSSYNSSTSSIVTQTITKASTSLALVSSANPSSYGSSVTFTVTVTPSASTGTVTFTDGGTTLGTGTISGGIATYSTSALAVASHSVAASYAGDANHTGSSSTTLTQVVNKANSTVAVGSSANPSVYGSPVTLTATVAPATATGTVTFKDGSTTLGTGTVSSGIATYGTSALVAGSHSIVASYGGDTNYNGSTSSTLTQTVNKATPTITWPTPSAITYGTALSATQLNATASVPGTFAYSPVSGTVPGAGTRSLSVTFTPTDTTDYTTATAAVQLVVNKATPTITWPTPAAITYGTALSATQLNATASVAGTFVYNPASGILTAGTQSLNVTFTPTDTADYTTATATVLLVLNNATPTITWPTPAAITYGTALSATQLNATASVSGTFVYNPASGILTAGTQPLGVTFTPTDTTDYTTATATVQLVVNKATPTITWATPAPITYGTALSAAQLNAAASVPGTLAYNPSSGILTAGTQPLSVTFTPTDTTDYSTANATVQLVVNKATPTITWATPAAITYGTALSAAQLNATASVPGTFTYNPASGILTAGTQALGVTFTPTDMTDYTTATATVQLVVNKATPTITWPAPAAITYGTALSAAQLNATASVPGTFGYSPAVGAVPGAGTQTLSVTFTPTDATDYTTATASVQLVVNKATPTITWPTPTAITYGTALGATQLNATASVPGTFAYNPASGILTAGTQTMSVTFTPTDTTDYTTATATVQLAVNKATPAITWPTPTAITYGTALSAAQLNATANIQGTFVYNPALTSVPPAGTQTLSVTFTPADTADYTTATSTVQLVVNPGNTTVALVSSPNPSDYGTSATFTATVTPITATGTCDVRGWRHDAGNGHDHHRNGDLYIFHAGGGFAFDRGILWWGQQLQQ